MTRKVEFLDTSLRDGEQTPGVNFSIKEKVSIAKQAERSEEGRVGKECRSRWSPYH